MPFQEVPAKVDFPAQERQLLQFWKENRLFDRLRQLHTNDPPWSFIEGPITAQVSASALQLHRDAIVIVEQAAGAKLKRADYYRWVFEQKKRLVPKLLGQST